MEDQLLFKEDKVQLMGIVFGNDNDIGAAVTPWQEVGVVFLDGKKDDWAMRGGDTWECLRVRGGALV